VIVLHAHPDDEAIFTGATIRRLADRGARVILVTATGGELGEILTPLAPGERVAQRRARELRHAAELLGASRVVTLGRRDSGLAGWVDNDHPDALTNARTRSLARSLARLVGEEGARALVHYDGHGIYEHPDHLAVHQVGQLAARLAGITAYEATIDADQLLNASHWPSSAGERQRSRSDRDQPSALRHLVQGASAANGVTPRRDGRAPWRSSSPEPARADQLGGTVPGSGTFDAALWIDATPGELAAKRAAMLAHASQIRPESVPAGGGFERLYGREWYFRIGAPSALDALLVPAPSARRDRGLVAPDASRGPALEPALA
jgi:LmbE family N-acetylglucosaminyl deacetylase